MKQNLCVRENETFLLATLSLNDTSCKPVKTSLFDLFFPFLIKRHEKIYNFFQQIEIKHSQTQFYRAILSFPIMN